MSNPDAIISSISDSDWNGAAKAAKTDVATLQAQLREVLSSDQGAAPPVSVTTGEPTEVETCIEIPFEVSFFRVLGINGTFRFCPGSDWTASLEVCALLLGNEVECFDFELNARNPEICREFNVFLASANVCFGLRIDGFCFYISGEACFLGDCNEFDETIHCFG